MEKRRGQSNSSNNFDIFCPFGTTSTIDLPNISNLWMVCSVGLSCLLIPIGLPFLSRNFSLAWNFLKHPISLLETVSEVEKDFSCLVAISSQ